MKQSDRDELLIRIDERVEVLTEHVDRQNGRVGQLESNQNKIIGGVMLGASFVTILINKIMGEG
jgi:hypothetical protein|tara:strand:- start:2515 stop:2706 length:192 start_codon:yes stop_codon:yes gene_type:complete